MAELFKEGDKLPTTALTAKPVGSGKEFNEEEVSPEEQATYDQFVLRAQEYMTKSPDAVVRSMNRPDQPVYKAVARTGAMIVEQVKNAAKAQGRQISPDVMFHAGSEVVEMLMELGDSAGVFPFKQSDKQYDETMAMAFYEGVKMFGDQGLQGENGPQMVEDAGNMLAQQIAAEQDRGEVDPKFWEGLERQKVMAADPNQPTPPVLQGLPGGPPIA